MKQKPAVRLSSVNLNLLVAFEALLEEGSVSRAADRIGLSQPSVSHALRHLRALFDDELFQRGPGGMVPTARARELATQVIPGLANLRLALNDRITFDPATSKRHFTLGLSDIGSFEVLPLLMPHLRRHAPEITVEVADVSAIEAVTKLHAGEIDLALNAFPELPADLLSEPLTPLEVVCLVDRNNPVLKDGALDLGGFLSAPHVAVGSPSSTVTPPDFALNAMGLRRRVVLHVPHFLAIPGAIVGTDLIAVFDAHAATRFAHLADLVAIAPPIPLQPPMALMVWHPRHNDDLGHIWLRSAMRSLHGMPGSETAKA